MRKASCPNLAVIAHRASGPRKHVGLWICGPGLSGFFFASREGLDGGCSASGWWGALSLPAQRAEDQRRPGCSAPPTPRLAAGAALPASAPTSSLLLEAPGAPGEARRRRSAARFRVPKLRRFPCWKPGSGPGSDRIHRVCLSLCGRGDSDLGAPASTGVLKATARLPASPLLLPRQVSAEKQRQEGLE